MPDGQVLEFAAVTKRFGAVTAVEGLTARVEPGRVTGFLGPNGAGKTTSLRMLLGLVRPTAGTATIGGRRYADLAHPLRTVGAVLEASSFHPGRSAANHLRVFAQAARLPASSVDTALGLVGLSDVAGRKVGGFSLGMRQRLGLAYALLGDPGVLVLDEPTNGLDPEGIRWIRGFLYRLAEEGRTVLVSSHLLAEVQQSVDALIIIARGRTVFQGEIEDLADPDDYATVVDAPDRAALEAALGAAGIEFTVLRSGLTIRTAEPEQVGALAASAGIALSVLQRRGPSLEEVFLELVSGVRTHASAAAAPGPGAAVEPVPEDAAPEDAVRDDAVTETAPPVGAPAGPLPARPDDVEPVAVVEVPGPLHPTAAPPEPGSDAVDGPPPAPDFEAAPGAPAIEDPSTTGDADVRAGVDGPEEQPAQPSGLAWQPTPLSDADDPRPEQVTDAAAEANPDGTDDAEGRR